MFLAVKKYIFSFWQYQSVENNSISFLQKISSNLPKSSRVTLFFSTTPLNQFLPLHVEPQPRAVGQRVTSPTPARSRRQSGRHNRTRLVHPMLSVSIRARNLAGCTCRIANFEVGYARWKGSFFCFREGARLEWEREIGRGKVGFASVSLMLSVFFCESRELSLSGSARVVGKILSVIFLVCAAIG